jgi:DNA-binding transcriptional LysR family regulator
VSLAQIRYFVTVAEEGHVGRAAQKLHVAQPPISRQIRALEDELGAPLFARTPRGMTLLPAGEAFLGHARGILDAVARAKDAVTSASPATRRSTSQPATSSRR